MTRYQHREAVEDAVRALSAQFGCEERFIRHALGQAQELANEYGRAGYSPEMALTETLLAIAMIAHRMETDHKTLAQILVRRLAHCYDAVGRVHATRDDSIEAARARGGALVHVS